MCISSCTAVNYTSTLTGRKAHSKDMNRLGLRLGDHGWEQLCDCSKYQLRSDSKPWGPLGAYCVI